MGEVAATIVVVLCLMRFAEWYTGLDDPLRPSQRRKRAREEARYRRWLNEREDV